MPCSCAQSPSALDSSLTGLRLLMLSGSPWMRLCLHPTSTAAAAAESNTAATRDARPDILLKGDAEFRSMPSSRISPTCLPFCTVATALVV